MVPKSIIVLAIVLLIGNCDGQQTSSRRSSSSSTNLRHNDRFRNNPLNKYQSMSIDGDTNSDTSAAQDIRKLLEDYVTYLSSLSDYQENGTSKKSQSRSSGMLQGRSVDQISSRESKQQQSLSSSSPSYQSSRNKFNSYPSILKQDQASTIIVNSKPTLIATTIQNKNNNGSSGNKNGQTTTTKFILELPTESGLSLNLNDDELNTFIDNVLGATDSSNLTTADSTERPYESSELQGEDSISTVPNLESETSIGSFPPTINNTTTIDTGLISASNNSVIAKIILTPSVNQTILSNQTELEEDSKFSETLAPMTITTTAASVETTQFNSRSEIFENSNEETEHNSNLSEEEFNDMVSREKQNNDGRYYTSDTTDSNLIDLTSTTTQSSIVDKINLTHIIINNNNQHNNNSIDNDETSSNNFNQMLSNHDDTELLREMQKTKDLLRVQMDLLKDFNISMVNSDYSIENSNNVNGSVLLESIPTTTAIPTTFTESFTSPNTESESVSTEMPTTATFSGNELLPETTTTAVPEIASTFNTLNNNYKIDDDSFEPDEPITTTVTPASAVTEFTDSTPSSVIVATTTTTTPTVNVETNDNDDKLINNTTFKSNFTQLPQPTTKQNWYTNNSSNSNAQQTITTATVSRVPKTLLYKSKAQVVSARLFTDSFINLTETKVQNKNNNSINHENVTTITTTNLNNNISGIVRNETNNDRSLSSVMSLSASTADEHHMEYLNQPQFDNGNHELEREDENDNNNSKDGSNSFNSQLNNYLNESNDGETMILTHVPKITIIHKIVKPSGSRNGNQTDEEVYKETLRKHKDLIKTAMNSISLYPAAFKRYKLNSNSKVNSVGEIYLLPNFARNMVNSQRLLHNPQPQLPPPPMADANTDQQTQSNKNQFIQILQKHLSRNQNKQVLIRQAPHKKMKIKKIKDNQNFDRKLEVAESITSTDNQRQQLIVADVMDPKLNSKLSSSSSASTANNNPDKQYMKNIDSNSFQNPENILNVFRPRIHKRKFKKVRIPNVYRPTRKNSQYISTTDASTRMPTITTTTTSAAPTQTPTTTTPLPITAQDDNKVETMATSTTSMPTTTTALPQLFHTNNTTNINQNSNGGLNSFKVFCTYDAHRSLSFPPKENYGQFFDIVQLERNSAILDQCTHLVYAFANINMNGEVFAAFPSILDDALRAESEQNNHENIVRIQRLKQSFPNLRVLVAIGGWDTPPQLFSLLVSTSKLRDRLSQNIHNFVLNYDFDGAIISWFYPVYGSKPVPQDNAIGRSARSTSTAQSVFQLDDKQNLVRLMRTLRTRFDSFPNKPLEIGLMSPPFDELIDRGYDVGKLSEIVDHMILMTYDYYGSWQDKVHHFAPLYPSETDMLNERDRKLNINHTIDYWINSEKAPRNKTVLGLAFYGRSFTLENSSVSGPGAPAIGPGIAGPATNKPGLLAFNELCDLYLGHQDVRLREDEHRITANLQLYDQWVGFDDELSLYLKTKYAIANRLSGIFIWSINHDDFRNRCGWGRFPLLKAVNKAIEHCRLSNNQCLVV